ncbi:MAG: O-methyltransferase, partial [Planctomycetota bacterium]
MGISFLNYEPQRLDEYAGIGRGDANNWSMGPQEGLFLCSLLTAIRARKVVEIGTNVGHSTLFICHALRAVGYPDAVLHSFEISKRAKTARGHIARYGYDAFAHVHQMRSTSREASAIRDRIALIDAILIDGDHSFEGSYADFLFWADGVRPG